VAYRTHLGLSMEVAMGVVVQAMVPATVAGVAFTCDPLTGADTIIVEAAYGLGEVLVSGEVTPDHWEVARDRTVLRHRAGDRDIAIVPAADGIERTEVARVHRVVAPLDGRTLAAVVDLAIRCETILGRPQDVEWALHGDRIALLQSRAVTRQRGPVAPIG
jgi:pyruvate,water dikinase